MRPTEVTQDIIFTWLFHHKVETLENAYRSAKNAFDNERTKIEEQYERHVAKVAAGEAVMVEEDEDGYPVFDYGEHAGELIDEVDSFLKVLRETFCVSLHHLWEREMLKRYPPPATKRGKMGSYNHQEIMTRLSADGFTADAITLDTLRCVANTVKHSAGKSANDLFALRPDLFDPAVRTAPRWKPNYSDLQVTGAIVDDFFTAVSNAVPTPGNMPVQTSTPATP